MQHLTVDAKSGNILFLINFSTICQFVQMITSSHGWWLINLTCITVLTLRFPTTNILYYFEVIFTHAILTCDMDSFGIFWNLIMKKKVVCVDDAYFW
jgi:hypothetical protein